VNTTSQIMCIIYRVSYKGFSWTWCQQTSRHYSVQFVRRTLRHYSVRFV